MKPRQIRHASLFYRLSIRGKNATNLDAKEAATLTASLTPREVSFADIHEDPAANDDDAPPKKSHGKSLSQSVTQSWKVSDDEYVIEIDASPLHMSAAQRKFGGAKATKRKTEGEEEESPEEEVGEGEGEAPEITSQDVDAFIAMIDSSPLHMSAAQRMFGGKVEKKEEAREEEVQNEDEEVPKDEGEEQARDVQEEEEATEEPKPNVEETRQEEVEEPQPNVDPPGMTSSIAVAKQMTDSVAIKQAEESNKEEEVDATADKEEIPEDETVVSIVTEKAEETEPSPAASFPFLGAIGESWLQGIESVKKSTANWAIWGELEKEKADASPVKEDEETATRDVVVQGAKVETSEDDDKAQEEETQPQVKKEKRWEEELRKVGTKWTQFWDRTLNKREGTAYDLMQSANCTK